MKFDERDTVGDRSAIHMLADRRGRLKFEKGVVKRGHLNLFSILGGLPDLTVQSTVFTNKVLIRYSALTHVDALKIDYVLKHDIYVA
jgi:hypothetical protein